MPLVYQSSINRDISANNLFHLLTCPCKETNEITTKVAQEAFEDYKRHDLGLCHQLKKYSASLIAYGGAIGVPVATVLGGAYYLLKDYIADPSLIFRQAVSRPDQEEVSGSALIGGNGGVTTTMALSTLAGLGLTDFAFYKTTGHRPIRAVSKWTVGVLTSALLYAAYKAGEITAGSYIQKENASQEIRKGCRETIFNQLKSTYDGVAQIIQANYNEARDNPAEMLELKKTAQTLQKKLPLFKGALAQLPLLPSEITQILDQLTTAANGIIAFEFKLRVPQSSIDCRYNVQLLALLSEEEFEGVGVPQRVQLLAKEINDRSLGRFHTIKSYADAAARTTGALLTGAALSVIAKTATQSAYGNSTDASYPIALAGAVIVPCAGAVYLGAKVKQRTLNFYSQRKSEADAIVEKNTKLIEQELHKVYDGIATYLRSSLQEWKQQVQQIRSKLPLIHAQLQATGAIENPQIYTQRLERILQPESAG